MYHQSQVTSSTQLGKCHDASNHLCQSHPHRDLALPPFHSPPILDNVVDTIPIELQEIHLVLAEVLRVFRVALHTLEQQRLVAYLTIHRRLALFLQAHGHLPAIDDVDDTDNSQP